MTVNSDFCPCISSNMLGDMYMYGFHLFFPGKWKLLSKHIAYQGVNPHEAYKNVGFT